MRVRLLFVATLLIFGNHFIAQSFKKLYKESFKYLEVNDYENALPLLMKMHDLRPNNANTNFSIGNCLMNIIHREKRLFHIMKKLWKG